MDNDVFAYAVNILHTNNNYYFKNRADAVFYAYNEYINYYENSGNLNCMDAWRSLIKYYRIPNFAEIEKLYIEKELS